MSVQTEIGRLRSAKSAIAAAIADKGVTVPDGTKLDGMAALIDSIEAYDMSAAALARTAATLVLDPAATSIGDNAFYKFQNLALTSLPSSLTTIGDYAFYNCSNLALTSLPSSLTSIGNYAFNGCAKLTELTFKGTPTSISSSAFRNCSKLLTINVPWAEGAVAFAPWGAANATINYNYTGA